MLATVMYRAGDVRVENIPDAAIVHPTDAVIRITRACICGSYLWPYNELEPVETGRRMGHEAIGIVEAVGADVRKVKRGDVVMMPLPSPTAPACSATRVCKPRAFTAAFLALAAKPVARRPKLYASVRRCSAGCMYSFHALVPMR